MDYMTITGLNKYISESTWHAARTMPGIPHSYVRKHEGDRQAFDALCRYIKAWGKDERFYSRTYRYLHLAGHKYWGHLQYATIEPRANMLLWAWLKWCFAYWMKDGQNRRFATG